ncbi:hypothetical protein ABFS83_11G014600 [Erythranthe nasuta]
MASRQVIQQQKAGEAVAPAGIKAKNMAAERKNRRALGDIGNVVTVRGGVEAKPLLPQVSRPITRGFRAKLLANNTQTTAIENKSLLVPNGALPEKKAVAKKPIQKKAVVISKPKPEEKIESSSDSNVVDDKAKKPVIIIRNENDKPVEEMSSLKKKAPTLTSTLTARSKAALQIVDIDADDVDNDLAVVEYVEDMYKFYKSAENEGRAHGYLFIQPEINEKMRAILIDWLVQVHQKFDLSPETLYLTINIIDRYLASKTTPMKELQLVGMSSMLIASKYEEIWAPQVNELVSISDRTYTNKQVLTMEKRILSELEWNLTVPTPYVFLVRFIKASMTGLDVENMVYFLAELGMMNYEILTYSPSMIAASAVYAARATLNTTPLWNETLEKHTGFTEAQITDCAKVLVRFHWMAVQTQQQKLRGVYKKYCASERRGVAVLPPAKFLLDVTHLSTDK